MSKHLDKDKDSETLVNLYTLCCPLLRPCFHIFALSYEIAAIFINPSIVMIHDFIVLSINVAYLFAFVTAVC